MISWKHSFKRLNEEYEMVGKKKQALDNLLNSGRISQSTHELFNGEIEEALAEIGRQQKALLGKMDLKIAEFEGQIKTFEILLANFEIQHVGGEVDEEVYQRETNLLSIGLETARHELNAIKEAVSQLSNITQIPAPEVIGQQGVETRLVENVEASKTEVVEQSAPAVEEKKPDSSVEHVEISEKESSEAPQEQPQETLQTTEQSELKETASEEKHEN